MRRILLLFAICYTVKGFTQEDTTKWLRAFPITSYMVELNDSTKVVQVQMPDGFSIPEKQLGVIFGVYRTGREDAINKGYGRCHLIKGDYYYFSIGHNKSGKTLQEGDIIYTYMNKTSVYDVRMIDIATHYIQLLDVYDKPLYDRYNIFSNWTEANENALLDSMVADIRFTGNYFIKEDPSQDKLISIGEYEGRKVFTVMAECKVGDLKDFLDYVIAKPRLYAGKEWKISEIFATWLSKGAPLSIDQ